MAEAAHLTNAIVGSAPVVLDAGVRIVAIAMAEQFVLRSAKAIVA